MKDQVDHTILDLEELEKILDTLEASTTEIMETTSKHSVRNNEKDRLLATATSVLEQLEKIRSQLKTSNMNAGMSRKLQKKLNIIAEQVPAIVTRVKETNVEDDGQYSMMLMVCNTVLIFCTYPTLKLNCLG